MNKFFVIPVLVIFISHLSYADMLDDREQSVVENQVEINQVSFALEQFSDTKDHYVLGTKGLV